MNIIIFIVLLIAYILDGYIRKKLYTTDINLARVQARKEFNNVSQNNIMEMININNFRYGISGEFEYDIKSTDRYALSGEQTFIGTGIVLDRKSVTRNDIVDDMAAFYQKNKKEFVADSKELRDRHIVVMYIQNNMNQFIWDDKELYDNVEKGEKVTISYNKKGVLSVGYKLKGKCNDSNPKKRLDLGENKRDS